MQMKLGTAAKPLSVAVNTEFLGYDGSWSTVNIQVGSTLQPIFLVPSTSTQETWVIGADGCEEDACQSKRGGLFFAHESLTFVERGIEESKNSM